MTQYYVHVSRELLESLDPGRLPDGFKFVMRWGPRTPDMECWLVDDFYAPAEFDGYLVEPVFSHDSDAGRTVITERRICTSTSMP